MKFTRYETAAEFSDDVLELLKKYEIQNNMFISNIGDGEGRTMLSVKDDDGKVLVAAIRATPYPMLMFETDNARNDDAVEYLVKSIIENGIDADFIMTEKALAKSFINLYQKHTGKTFKKEISFVLYVTDKVNEIPKIDGHLRAVTENDMVFLPYWGADFAPACNLGDYNLESGIKKAQNWVTNKNIMYIWEDNYPVSMAAAVREVTDCRFIGQVYTPPHFRGKGYSTACVYALTNKLLEEGYKYVALDADCDNPYSNAVYRKIGFKDVFYYDQYNIKE